MRLPDWLPAILLALAATTSGLLLWHLYQAEEAPPLTGPPRSDYFLKDFELVALDPLGKESFRVTGPLLSRHQTLGTIAIEEPRFHFPTVEGEPWSARAARGWANSNASEVRLEGEVVFDAPSPDPDQALTFRSENLQVFPHERRASSAAEVEFLSPHSILRGHGLRIDMRGRRFQLLDKVIGHYETPVSASHR